MAACAQYLLHTLCRGGPLFQYSLELDDYIIASTNCACGQLRCASRRAAGPMTSIKLMHVGIWPPSPSDVRVDSRNQALGSNPCFASLGIPSPRSGVQSALVPSHSQGGSPASLGLAMPTQTRKSIFFTFALIHVAHPLNSRRRVKKIHLRPHSSNSPKCPPLSSWFLAGPSSARHFRPLVQKSVSRIFSPTQAHGSWEVAKTPAEPSSTVSSLLSTPL